jgi:hypothetical protein
MNELRDMPFFATLPGSAASPNMWCISQIKFIPGQEAPLRAGNSSNLWVYNPKYEPLAFTFLQNSNIKHRVLLLNLLRQKDPAYIWFFLVCQLMKDGKHVLSEDLSSVTVPPSLLSEYGEDNCRSVHFISAMVQQFLRQVGFEEQHTDLEYESSSLRDNKRRRLMDLERDIENADKYPERSTPLQVLPRDNADTGVEEVSDMDLVEWRQDGFEVAQFELEQMDATYLFVRDFYDKFLLSQGGYVFVGPTWTSTRVHEVVLQFDRHKGDLHATSDLMLRQCHTELEHRLLRDVSGEWEERNWLPKRLRNATDAQIAEYKHMRAERRRIAAEMSLAKTRMTYGQVPKNN